MKTKNVKTLNARGILNQNGKNKTHKTVNCGECQASCQSACKTSCTVANQICENK